MTDTTQNTNPTPTNAADAKPTEVSLVESLQAQLKEAQSTAESFKAKYMTAVADQENMRKRHQREREEIARYSLAPTINELLPFVDSFALALEAARQHHPEAKAILDGFGMLQTQLGTTLENLGVKTLSPKAGDTFNPDFHQSVGEAPSDTVPHHAILNCQRAGYQLADRLLRPALVMLSSGKA